MDLPPKKVLEILRQHGVRELHHANSVLTSCQYLRRGALLSRGSVVRNGLSQTAQTSDASDRKSGLWFDVFVDSVDIHRRASRANLYGPVLFTFSSDILAASDSGRIWITKLNPTKWTTKKREERWFSSLGELEARFERGNFDQMIVFRHAGGEVPLDDHLRHLTLDDPKSEMAGNHVNLFSYAYGALASSMAEGGLEVPILRRVCRSRCTCVSGYKKNPEGTRSMYAVNPSTIQ